MPLSTCGLEIAHDGGRGRDPHLLTFMNELSEILALERSLAREHLVEHEAERVDVTPRRDLAAGELLGRHVGRCPGAQRFAGHAGESEVRDAHVTRSVEHHVGRLEIAMDDATFVGGGETGADLACDREAAFFRKSADAFDQRREILAVHVLHREKGLPLHLVDVVDAADIRVRHLARHAHFGVELRQPRGIAIDVGRQELERDCLTELQVVGAVDLAHAAATEPSDDAVAAAEQGAGIEAAVVDGA